MADVLLAGDAPGPLKGCATPSAASIAMGNTLLQACLAQPVSTVTTRCASPRIEHVPERREITVHGLKCHPSGGDEGAKHLVDVRAHCTRVTSLRSAPMSHSATSDRASFIVSSRR